LQPDDARTPINERLRETDDVDRNQRCKGKLFRSVLFVIKDRTIEQSVLTATKHTTQQKGHLDNLVKEKEDNFLNQRQQQEEELILQLLLIKLKVLLIIFILC